MYGGSTGESKQDLTAGAGDVAIAVEGEGVLRASLLGLSADLTAEVLSFLSGSEVGGLARVCRSLKDTTDDGRIWRGVYWREFDSGFGSKLSLRVRNPKKVYVDRVRERKSRIEERSRVRDQWQKQVAAIPGQRRCRYCLDFWNLAVFVGAPWLLMIASMVMLADKVDESTPDLSWYEVFAPIWAYAGFAFIMFVVMACVKAHDRYSNPASLCYKAYDTYNSRHIPREAIENIIERKPERALMCCCLGLVWAAAPVMIALKLEGEIDVNWGTTLIPLWLGFIWMGCFPMVASEDVSEGIPLFLGFTVLTSPLWVTLVLMCIRLDGGDMPVYFMFMPLWIVDGLGLIGLICGCMIVSVLMLREGTRTEVPIMWSACMAVLLFAAGPIILFEVLAALKDAEEIDISWNEVFTPLLVWLSFIACAACVFAGFLFHESHRNGYHTITVARPATV